MIGIAYVPLAMVKERTELSFKSTAMGCLRKQDVLGRIGGEEFSCLLVATDEADAVQMAERIRQGFSELTMLMSPGGSVQASA